MQKTKPLPPFLKWAGGKTWLASRLAEMYEPFRSTHTWVEPFCGALGATLGVMPERAILSDINPHLINFYKRLASPQSVGMEISATKEEYSLVVEKLNRFSKELTKPQIDQSDDVLNCLSAWFYYLNRTCFNGLCRFNRKGEFNVPYGKYKNPKLDHDFKLYQQAFENWNFYHLNFFAVLLPTSSFVYADPPYDDGFTSYSGSFTWNDQVNLASSLAALNCPVVASNKATDRIVDLYQGLGFDVEFIDVRRRIACNGDRTPVKEILATRNL